MKNFMRFLLSMVICFAIAFSAFGQRGGSRSSFGGGSRSFGGGSRSFGGGSRSFGGGSRSSFGSRQSFGGGSAALPSRGGWGGSSSSRGSFGGGSRSSFGGSSSTRTVGRVTASRYVGTRPPVNIHYTSVIIGGHPAYYYPGYGYSYSIGGAIVGGYDPYYNGGGYTQPVYPVQPMYGTGMGFIWGMLGFVLLVLVVIALLRIF